MPGKRRREQASSEASFYSARLEDGTVTLAIVLTTTRGRAVHYVLSSTNAARRFGREVVRLADAIDRGQTEGEVRDG